MPAGQLFIPMIKHTNFFRDWQLQVNQQNITCNYVCTLLFYVYYLPCLHAGQHWPSGVYISSPSPHTGKAHIIALQSVCTILYNYSLTLTWFHISYIHTIVPNNVCYNSRLFFK